MVIKSTTGNIFHKNQEIRLIDTEKDTPSEKDSDHV